MTYTGIKTGFIDLWNFDMGDWLIYLSSPMVLIGSALLLISLVLTLRASWRRLYALNRYRAVMVALGNLVAFITLLVLLIEPQRLHQVEQDVVLITEGTDMAVTNLPDDNNVYVSPGFNATSEALKILNNANWLLDIGQLQLREPALTNIDVTGFGLSRAQWQSLPPDIGITFQAPPIGGFIGMHWPRTLVAGETLHIGGYFSDPTVKPVITLRLLDPAGGMVDEARSRNEDYFSLSTRPKASGNLVYTLQAWSGDVLLSDQPVTTSVGNAATINIMVQQSAPSFETRQLKNYAAGNGAHVLINTQISRGKSITQSANLPDEADITFSPQTLAGQDILIMDGRALVQLADQQRQWLSDAITEGLGLLILADASLLEEVEKPVRGLLSGFELNANPGAQAEAVPRLLNNPASGWQQPLPVAAMQLQAIDADILIDNGEGGALVVSKSKGLGHIAISLISQSHRWLTAGNHDHWSDYWAALIAAISRQRADSYLLALADNVFTKQGERTPICAMSSSEKLVARIVPANTGNSMPGLDIPLSPDSLGSPRQCGWFWPQHSGWHQIHLHTQSSDSTLDQMGFFIFDQHQWLTQSRHKRVVSTNERASSNAGHQAESNFRKWVSEPLDVFWLYLLLVTSASLLWLERKQFNFQ